jgi:hypothetical protein
VTAYPDCCNDLQLYRHKIDFIEGGGQEFHAQAFNFKYIPLQIVHEGAWVAFRLCSEEMLRVQE